MENPLTTGGTTPQRGNGRSGPPLSPLGSIIPAAVARNHFPIVPPILGARTSEIVEGFYSFLGFTRLVTSTAIRKAIARGVQECAFGYVAGTAPSLGTDGKYQVSLAKVRLAAGVAEDEIDLESGFIMMPRAIPQPAPVPYPSPAVTPPTGTEPTSEGGMPVGEPGAGIASAAPPGAATPQKVVEISFSADPNQLFTAWNAIANLAALAGTVSVTVCAKSEEGFDRSKLQNGVIEPLREADLIE